MRYVYTDVSFKALHCIRTRTSVEPIGKVKNPYTFSSTNNAQDLIIQKISRPFDFLLSIRKVKWSQNICGGGNTMCVSEQISLFLSTFEQS